MNEVDRCCAWEPIYDKNLPPLERKPSEAVVHARDKIFDPNAERRGNVYRKLSEAIEDAQPGDTILIRYKGSRPIEPVELKKVDADVTIKPYEGYRPILMIGQTPHP
ncbi:MAG: hypothetical protein E6K70_26610 [Planctomycetota bacterium]|nr:MAG: hypothetical protein E6K70_26610 [Planctomycetota bacterium]